MQFFCACKVSVDSDGGRRLEIRDRTAAELPDHYARCLSGRRTIG